MTSCAWLWVYAGSFLMLLELIVPGFVLCFIGLGAATVGVLRGLIGESFGVAWQLAVFSLASVLYIVLFRSTLKKIFVGSSFSATTDFVHESVGRIARVTAAIEPPMPGRILLGDAEWTAISYVSLEVGRDVKIVAQDNLTMKVEPIA